MTYYPKKITTLLFLSCVFCSFFPVKGFTFNQQISVCYFDESRMSNYRLPSIPNFLKGRGKEDIDRGFMLFYEKRALNLLGVATLYVGGDIAKWSSLSDDLYTGSVFLAGRIWGFPVLFFKPYLEYSMLGPTIISHTHFGSTQFGSRFLFQNFLGIGAILGDSSGLNFDLKMIRYVKADLASPKEGFVIPLLASIGYLF